MCEKGVDTETVTKTETDYFKVIETEIGWLTEGSSKKYNKQK